MRTTSAPTYFPIYQGYADGGLFANNPSLSAISRAYAHFSMVTPENIVVLSIGTGHNVHEVEDARNGTTLDWGLQQWAPRLLDLLMEANQLSIEHTLRLMLKNRYHRLDAELETECVIDDSGAIDRLIAAADSLDLSEVEEFCLSEFIYGE